MPTKGTKVPFKSRKEYRDRTAHEVIVDVAAPADSAVEELRKDLWPTANVTLHCISGPSGHPQCKVVLGTQRMIQFLKDYHESEANDWLLSLPTPPIPASAL